MEPVRRAPGQLEAEVLAVLWGRDGAMTAAQVQEALDADLAYTTVTTILARLYTKGSLRRERKARAWAYRPATDRPGLTADRMRRVLDSDDDRQTVLARFVTGLPAEDERALRELLDSTETPDHPEG